MIDEKQVQGVYEAGSNRRVDDGFHVRNLFPSNDVTRQVDPFLMLDYAGPAKVEPNLKHFGSGEHTNSGFETVTIVYQGFLQHRDSNGNVGTIGPGDVRWLTAAAGVVHEDKYDPEFARQGGMVEMIQLWVNVPKAHKTSEPRYQTLLKEQIPVTTLGPAGYVRVIAGDMSGVEGPAQTVTPLGVFDLHLNAGRETEFCLCGGHHAAVVLLKGAVVVNGKTELRGEAHFAVLHPEGSMVTLAAREDSTILILSGEPINEPDEIGPALQGYPSCKIGL